MFGDVRHDLRLEFDGPGLAGDMGRIRLGDEPVVAAVDPGVEAALANQIDRLARDVGRHRLLLDDREIRLDEEPAVEARDRGIEMERLEQHGHAARRPAAGDSEADAGGVQGSDGLLRSLRQYFLLVDERAVHVREYERNFPAAAPSRPQRRGQSSGRQARPSRAINSPAAAGPLPPAT